jgi:cysteine desulfurase
MRRIYLDNNATTALAPEVLEEMLPYLREEYGNPSSFHTFGSSVLERVAAAREQVAAVIGARPEEVIFTSGGTESDNMALRGCSALRGGPVVTTAVEHPAVLETARHLGGPARIIGVDSSGLLDMKAYVGALEGASVASVMFANNETGTLMPVKEAADAAHEAGVPFHTDAVQAVGKVPVDVEDLGVDLLSLSAHKFHGPKGVGALYLRRGLSLPPLITGGHQEKGMRAGTYNAAGIIGMGMAATLAMAHLKEEKAVSSLLYRFEKGVLNRCPGAMVMAESSPRLPNTSTVIFRGIESEAVLTLLDIRGIYASSGSACSTGSKDPSHVLMAMGLDHNLANSAVRFSLGRYNTMDEVDFTVDVLAGIVEKLRAISPYT